MVQKRHCYTAQCIYTKKNKKLRIFFLSLCFFSSNMPEPHLQSWATSPNSTLFSYLQGPRNKRSARETLGPQVTSFTAQTRLSFHCPLLTLWIWKKSNGVWVFHKRKWKISKQTANTMLKLALWQGNILLQTDLENPNNFTCKHLHTPTHMCIHTHSHTQRYLSQLSEIRVSSTWTLDWTWTISLVLWLM